MAKPTIQSLNEKRAKLEKEQSDIEVEIDKFQDKIYHLEERRDVIDDLIYDIDDKIIELEDEIEDKEKEKEELDGWNPKNQLPPNATSKQLEARRNFFAMKLNHCDALEKVVKEYLKVQLKA